MDRLFVPAVALNALMASYAFAADNLPANTDDCAAWGLTGHDLADCRAEWSTAKTDSERAAIRAKFVAKASAPPPEVIETTTGKAPSSSPDKSTTTDPLMKPTIPATTGEHRTPRAVPVVP